LIFHKVWLLHDFLKQEECDELMNYGAKNLQAATVTGFPFFKTKLR